MKQTCTDAIGWRQAPAVLGELMEYQISHRSLSLAEETRGNTRGNALRSRGITRGAGSVGIIAGVSVPTPEPEQSAVQAHYKQRAGGYTWQRVL